MSVEPAPQPFVGLGDAAVAAVAACARAFQTDGRNSPADADTDALWPPVHDVPEFD